GYNRKQLAVRRVGQTPEGFLHRRRLIQLFRRDIPHKREALHFIEGLIHGSHHPSCTVRRRQRLPYASWIPAFSFPEPPAYGSIPAPFPASTPGGLAFGHRTLSFPAVSP